MKIKSYYSRTVEDAIATARQEMGPEAMLVNSRKAPLEARHLGEYEVVFADVGPDTASADSSAFQAGESALLPSPSADRFSNEMADLKRELEVMRRALNHTVYAPGQWRGNSSGQSDAHALLVAADISPVFARELVDAAEGRLSHGVLPHQKSVKLDGEAFQRALTEELTSRFTVAPTLGCGPATPRIVALTGPPGAGKTTTLVKLAVHYGLAARRPPLLLSIDTNRVAAADQLRSFAAILGVGFQSVETVAALAQAIEENRGKELIFIDTPGLAFSDLEDAQGLAAFLATREDIDTHLVLPASMKANDLARMVNAFGIVRPRHLLFTKLDETSSFGPIFSEAARSSKPLSFLSTGQRIPEDLEAATVERVLGLVLQGTAALSRSAA